MFRTLFNNLSKWKWAQDLIMHWGPAWRAASRFIAGEKIDQAIAVIRKLNASGIDATLDHLGEHTTSIEDARQATTDILIGLGEIAKTNVRSNVSIKLSQVGLLVDEKACRENLAVILERAHETGNFVRIDMEEAALVERTIKIYEWARAEGFANTGLVFQSYLYRTEADLERLEALAPRIRLCKGAYKESPQVAYPDKRDVDHQYDRLAKRLIKLAQECGVPGASPDGRFPPIPAFATHDPVRIDQAKAAVLQAEMPIEAFEFQMLYGIRRDLQQKLVDDGYRVRVYVPYGSHWYPYFMRRLGERPANVYFFLSNLVRK